MAAQGPRPKETVRIRGIEYPAAVARHVPAQRTRLARAAPDTGVLVVHLAPGALPATHREPGLPDRGFLVRVLLAATPAEAHAAVLAALATQCSAEAAWRDANPRAAAATSPTRYGLGHFVSTVAGIAAGQSGLAHRRAALRERQRSREESAVAAGDDVDRLAHLLAATTADEGDVEPLLELSMADGSGRATAQRLVDDEPLLRQLGPPPFLVALRPVPADVAATEAHARHVTWLQHRLHTARIELRREATLAQRAAAEAQRHRERDAEAGRRTTAVLAAKDSEAAVTVVHERQWRRERIRHERCAAAAAERERAVTEERNAVAAAARKSAEAAVAQCAAEATEATARDAVAALESEGREALWCYAADAASAEKLRRRVQARLRGLNTEVSAVYGVAA